MIRIFLLLFSFALVSCASTVPKEVKIPIAVSPRHIQLSPKPYLPIADLDENSPPADVMRKYVATVKILSVRVNACEDMLNAVD